MKAEIKKQLRNLGYKGKIDLETMLMALPMGIDRDDKRYDLVIEQRVFFYYSDDDGNELEEFSIMREENESLADTAARLLILLIEQGIVEIEQLTSKEE